MRGRDRLFGTVAIWFAVAIMMNNLMDRFIRITADFTGLWPPINFYGEFSTEQFDVMNQITETGNRVGNQIFGEVNDILAHQMSTNLPMFVVLALALIVAATLSTYFVWRNAHLETDTTSQSQPTQSSTQKSKRSSRVEQVVNALDEEELAELRLRLMSENQTDAVSLEELLTAREPHRYRDT
jgi:hypothetical protein